MRSSRLLGEGVAHYHCMSRVVDRRRIFGAEEKEYFRKVMRGLEAFSGVRVVTFCIMSNHFHLLLEVPDKESLKGAEEISDEELVGLVAPLYGEGATERLRLELANCVQFGLEAKREHIRVKILKRRGDLSCFMKELKQRFTQWFNRKEGRRGTLWEDRFKSVLVEGGTEALLTMAVYIDLNPVRGGMVGDPADYRWSGYGEACAGKQLARSGLAVALEWSGHYEGRRITWREVGEQYRRVMFGAKGMPGDGRAFDPEMTAAEREAALKEIAGGGRLPLARALRCRVRYFSDGAIFGTRAFVDSVFKANRDRYGAKRKTGARKMKGGEFGEMTVLRDLQEEVFS